jgi:hypothetical protein
MIPALSLCAWRRVNRGKTHGARAHRPSLHEQVLVGHRLQHRRPHNPQGELLPVVDARVHLVPLKHRLEVLEQRELRVNALDEFVLVILFENVIAGREAKSEKLVPPKH